MIQRDYAQGRLRRRKFVNCFSRALESALKLPADDPSLPLNLDFIYGSVEGQEETRFSPLDGQQRLTTLFLLHWYLAWRDGCWEDFRKLFRATRTPAFPIAFVQAATSSSTLGCLSTRVAKGCHQPERTDHRPALVFPQLAAGSDNSVRTDTCSMPLHRRFAGTMVCSRG